MTPEFCIWWALSGRYAGHGGFRRAGADRHQTRAGLYSTMSQIGYMFTALGVQAWMRFLSDDPCVLQSAALFWRPGSVILACHHEQIYL